MRIPFSSRVAAVTFTLLAGLALYADDKVAINPEVSTASKMREPSYDQEGRLLRPVGFEKWVVVGTSIGLGYSDGDKNDPKNPGTFHNVYLQPEAFDHFVQTGEFPEQTVFIVTNNKSRPANTKGSVSRKGFVASPTSGLEVAVKDTKRFPDGWAYFMFHDAPEKAKPETVHAERAFDRKDCFDCHAEHGADDNVFTQYYSVLTEARQKHLNADTADQ
jgi:hypothetical protein